MNVLDRLGHRGALVLAGAVTVAVLGGVAVAVVTGRDDGRPNALVPLNPTNQPVVAPTSATPEVTSAAPAPRPTTASPTASPTPSPTPRPPPPPAPTVAPTTGAPKPSPGKALVVIDNRSTVDARVTINGGRWFVPSGTERTVEVTPEPQGHDSVSVADAEHDGCGMADSDRYFEKGRTFTLAITPSRDCYPGGGSTAVDSLTWKMTPAPR